MRRMPTIFTRIVAGELPGVFVWRDERCVAFLSINPMAPGHTLVVPLDEIDHWIDAPADLVGHLMGVAHAIGRAQQTAFSCERVGLIIAGYEVPHLHVHVVPTDDMSQLSFANAARSVTREALEDAAGRIRLELERMGHTEVST
jgi:diadenosine tetraphosphate (Ap4A) HIT family hydrolase